MSESEQRNRDAASSAERMRTACIEAAQKAYEEAGFSGLCAAGRWECALQAMRAVRIDAPREGAPSAPDGDLGCSPSIAAAG